MSGTKNQRDAAQRGTAKKATLGKGSALQGTTLSRGPKTAVNQRPDAKESAVCLPLHQPLHPCLLEGPFAHVLDIKDLKALGRRFKEHTYQKGDTIHAQGSAVEHLTLVVEGSVGVLVGDYELGTRGPGQILDDRLLVDPLTDKPLNRPYAHVAAVTTKVLWMQKATLQRLCRARPAVAEGLGRLAKYKYLDSSLALVGATDLDADKKELLYCQFQYSVYGQGQSIFREGEFGTEMFVLAVGEVEMAKELVHVYTHIDPDNPEPSAPEVRRYVSGEYFGEFSLCMNLPRLASATCTAPTLLLRLGGQELLKILKLVPEMRKTWKASFEATVKARVLAQLQEFEVPFLAEFGDKEYSRMAELTQLQHMLKDQVVFAEGSKGNMFYMIADGECKASVNGVNVSVMGPGSYFGEIALVKDTPRTATVTTSKACLMLVCKKQAFTKLFAELPSVEADFQAHLAPHDMKIEHIIHHKTALRYFTQQLEEEFSDENLKFVRRITEYRVLADGDPAQYAEAESIYRTHLAPDAEVPVNIPAPLYKAVRDQLAQHSADRSMFNLCLVHILHVLSTDSLQRFKRGKYFKEFVDSLHTYKGVSEEVRIGRFNRSFTTLKTLSVTQVPLQQQQTVQEEPTTAPTESASPTTPSTEGAPARASTEGAPARASTEGAPARASTGSPPTSRPSLPRLVQFAVDLVRRASQPGEGSGRPPSRPVSVGSLQQQRVAVHEEREGGHAGKEGRNDEGGNTENEGRHEGTEPEGHIGKEGSKEAHVVALGASGGATQVADIVEGSREQQISTAA